MADNDTKSFTTDEQRIDGGQPEAIREWAHKLFVSEEELKTAIMQVGNRVRDLEHHLKMRGDKPTR